MTDVATVLERLGGRRGLIDGALPPLLFGASNSVAVALGHGESAVPVAAVVAVACAVALGAVRRIQGTSVAGVLRGLVVLAIAAGFALWSGHARDFYLPGMVVDAGYAIALAASVLIGARSWAMPTPLSSGTAGGGTTIDSGAFSASPPWAGPGPTYSARPCS
jgi:hypothetical protein